MHEIMTAFVLAEFTGDMTFRPLPVGAGYARLIEGKRGPAKTSDGWNSLLPYTHRHRQTFLNDVGREDLVDKCSMATRADRNAYL